MGGGSSNEQGGHLLYFVERITIFSWLFYVLPCLISDRLAGNVVENPFISWRYGLGVWLARLTSWLRVSCKMALAFRFPMRANAGAVARILFRRVGISLIVHHPTFQSVLRDGRFKTACLFSEKAGRHFLAALLMILLAAWKSSMEKDGCRNGFGPSTASCGGMNRALRFKARCDCQACDPLLGQVQRVIQSYFLSKIRVLRNRCLF